jgi:hypothetical protein
MSEYCPMCNGFEREIRRLSDRATAEAKIHLDYVTEMEAQLSQAQAEIAALRLQVEGRDRAIIGLLATLSETEKRLPGITGWPRLKETP